MKRYGIFGGTFDPVHDGHLDIARSARDLLELDTVYIMLEKKPWGDKQTATVNDRRAMLALAIREEDKIEELDVGDEHFTISSTLPKIEEKLKGGELYFIFGADIFMKIDEKQWPGLDKLLKHYLVVFERRMITEKQISAHARTLGIAVAIIPSGLPHHSSTDVRAQIHDKALWLPKTVADYIDTHKLYM